MSQHCCEDMRVAVAEDDLPIVYVPNFREYGIQYTDGGTAYHVIAWCPWCGARLPESLRDAWFDELEALGIDPDDSDLPVRYRTEAWWRAKEAEDSRPANEP